MFSKSGIFFCGIYQLNHHKIDFADSKKSQTVVVHPTTSKTNTSESLVHWLKHEELGWIVSAGTKWVSELRSYNLIGDDGSALTLQISHGNLA